MESEQPGVTGQWVSAAGGDNDGGHFTRRETPTQTPRHSHTLI